jgi:tRNA threonylcarbamoyladenosine biosynthesis protein TsaB
MRLLLIHTCGAEGVVGLAEDAAVVAEAALPGRAASEELVPAVRRLMAERGWRVNELAAVAVVVGPGSFTGVRVGLSAAKGFCEAGGVGLVGLSRLALVAGDGDRAALLDAGRGEYYCGLYRLGEMVSEELLRAEAVAEILASKPGVTCESAVAERLAGAVELVREPGAVEILTAALRRIEAGAWSDVATLDANYLRRTDAELLVKGR